MTNWRKMHAILKKQVFPYLQNQGFQGEYPHFKRQNGDGIELISFAPNPRGGSFSVVVSIAFPTRRNTNLLWYDPSAQLTAFQTKKRYTKTGMFGGEFFYCDIYQKHTRRSWWNSWKFGTCTDYAGALTEEKAAQWLDSGYTCIKRFDAETPQEICNLLIAQLEDASRWMQQFEKCSR